MDNPIFKYNRRSKHVNETLPFSSITALMKRISQQLSKGKSKPYKFTGNRAMAKRARGNHFLSGFVGKLKSQVKLSGIYYGLVEVKDHRVAIIAIANKQFLKFTGKEVSLEFKENHGITKIIKIKSHNARGLMISSNDYD